MKLYGPPGFVPADLAKRAQFYRWMLFVPANIYAMFDIGGAPSRWIDGEKMQQALKEESVGKQQFFCSLIERDLAPAPYVLGTAMTALVAKVWEKNFGK